jgi:hypothetical protein
MIHSWFSVQFNGAIFVLSTSQTNGAWLGNKGGFVRRDGSTLKDDVCFRFMNDFFVVIIVT